MGQSIPLSRFPLLAYEDVDAVITTLNRAAVGERSCLSAPSKGGDYDFNFRRLGPVGVLSHAMPASTIRYREDSAGAFYLCAKNRLRMT